MKTALTYIIAGGLIVAMTGCSTMSTHEKEQYVELESYNLEKKKAKSPTIAGVTQILPGVGNIYLAVGTDEKLQYLPGVLNIIPGWLIWPIGCAWAIPQGVIDANTINKKESVYYYTKDPEGIAELQKIKTEGGK